MTFSTAIETCFSKYAIFKGRAPRSEYWWFYLFCGLCSLVGLSADLALGIPIVEDHQFTGGPAFWLVTLPLLLPNLSVSVRRLHDINFSGWWFWIQMVPFVGGLLNLLWMCRRGTDGENDYGPEFDTDVAEVFE